jgi:DNA-binding NarL/FixJ family response regulator
MVARRAARGETHKQIAQALDRSPATIRNQIQSIYEKLEVGNVAGLVKQLALAGWPGPATQRRERPSNA